MTSRERSVPHPPNGPTISSFAVSRTPAAPCPLRKNVPISVSTLSFRLKASARDPKWGDLLEARQSRRREASPVFLRKISPRRGRRGASPLVEMTGSVWAVGAGALEAIVSGRTTGSQLRGGSVARFPLLRHFDRRGAPATRSGEIFLEWAPPAWNEGFHPSSGSFLRAAALASGFQPRIREGEAEAPAPMYVVDQKGVRAKPPVGPSNVHGRNQDREEMVTSATTYSGRLASAISSP